MTSLWIIPEPGHICWPKARSPTRLVKSRKSLDAHQRGFPKKNDPGRLNNDESLNTQNHRCFGVSKHRWDDGNFILTPSHPMVDCHQAVETNQGKRGMAKTRLAGLTAWQKRPGKQHVKQILVGLQLFNAHIYFTILNILLLLSLLWLHPSVKKP